MGSRPSLHHHRRPAPWRVTYSSQVKKTLRKLDDHSPFLNALAKILWHPFHGPDIRPLRGMENGFRVKVNGRERLVYQVLTERRTIHLLRYDHRDAIYPS